MTNQKRTVGLAHTADEAKPLKAAGARPVWLPHEADEVLAGNALRAGDVLLLASPDALGPTASIRAARLKDMAERGVLVATIGDEPILYDTAELRAEFRSRAVTAYRARAAKKLRPKGRPPKLTISADQRDRLCPLWWDKNIPRPVVLDHAAEIIGHDIDVARIKRVCGAARKKPHNAKEQQP